eukprot:scaffold27789_cov140-Isochrysis_galbana.AAC.2
MWSRATHIAHGSAGPTGTLVSMTMYMVYGTVRARVRCGVGVVVVARGERIRRERAPGRREARARGGRPDLTPHPDPIADRDGVSSQQAGRENDIYRGIEEHRV